MPARPVDELRLLHQAARAYPSLGFHDLSTATLARVTRERGVDFATALLYDRLRRSTEHGRFIAQLEALEPNLDALPRLEGAVLVAPAAFYQELPEFGGDGQLIRDIAAEFGLRAALLSVPSTGSVSENAAAIRRALAAEQDGAVAIISLSKGGADVRLALEAGGPAIRKVRVWLQLGGLVRGSPVANQLLGGAWWRRALLSGVRAATGASDGLVRELATGPGSLLGRPAAAPTGVLVINVVGFPLSCHLSGSVRRRHRQLARLGPNDGSTLLREAMLEPGLVYPVWGAEHYFRVPRVSHLLYALFLYLARTGHLRMVGQAAQPVPVSVR